MGTESTRGSESPAVEARLAVEVDGPRIVAILTFHNRSPRAAYLWKRTALLEGEPRDQVLHLTSRGKEVPYAGRQMMRPLPAPADFAELAPGASLQARLRIDPLFRLPAGKRTYHLIYDCAWAVFDAPASEASHGLRSNEVELTLERRGRERP